LFIGTQHVTQQTGDSRNRKQSKTLKAKRARACEIKIYRYLFSLVMGNARVFASLLI